MGFLQENTPTSELPLLISFEAKSLGDAKFKLAKLRMEVLGYAVSKFANDGFALLRGDRMFQKQSAAAAAAAAAANIQTKTTTAASSSSPDLSPHHHAPDEKETTASSSIMRLTPDTVQESISISTQVLTTHFGAIEGPEEDKEPI